MTCSKTRTFELSMTHTFDFFDDDKTPEYPLSDDHPLSLHYRRKLMNMDSDLSAQYEDITPSSSPTCSTSPLKETPTSHVTNTYKLSAEKSIEQSFTISPNVSLTVDTKKDVPATALLGAQVSVFQKGNTIRPRNTLFKLDNRMCVIDALDLALKTKETISRSYGSLHKHDTSLVVRSLVDPFIDNISSRISGREENNFSRDTISWLCKLSKRLSNNSNFNPDTSIDSNNNSGGHHVSDDVKVCHSSVPVDKLGREPPVSLAIKQNETQADDTDMPKIEISSSPTEDVQNNRNKLRVSSDSNPDTEDKNAPPLLSPVFNISPKFETYQTSGPPNLTPIEVCNSYGSQSAQTLKVNRSLAEGRSYITQSTMKANTNCTTNDYHPYVLKEELLSNILSPNETDNSSLSDVDKRTRSESFLCDSINESRKKNENIDLFENTNIPSSKHQNDIDELNIHEEDQQDNMERNYKTQESQMKLNLSEMFDITVSSLEKREGREHHQPIVAQHNLETNSHCLKTHKQGNIDIRPSDLTVTTEKSCESLISQDNCQSSNTDALETQISLSTDTHESSMPLGVNTSKSPMSLNMNTREPPMTVYMDTGVSQRSLNMNTCESTMTMNMNTRGSPMAVNVNTGVSPMSLNMNSLDSTMPLGMNTGVSPMSLNTNSLGSTMPLGMNTGVSPTSLNTNSLDSTMPLGMYTGVSPMSLNMKTSESSMAMKMSTHGSPMSLIANTRESPMSLNMNTRESLMPSDMDTEEFSMETQMSLTTLDAESHRSPMFLCTDAKSVPSTTAYRCYPYTFERYSVNSSTKSMGHTATVDAFTKNHGKMELGVNIGNTRSAVPIATLTSNIAPVTTRYQSRMVGNATSILPVSTVNAPQSSYIRSLLHQPRKQSISSHVPPFTTMNTLTPYTRPLLNSTSAPFVVLEPTTVSPCYPNDKLIANSPQATSLPNVANSPHVTNPPNVANAPKVVNLHGVPNAPLIKSPPAYPSSALVPTERPNLRSVQSSVPSVDVDQLKASGRQYYIDERAPVSGSRPYGNRGSSGSKHQRVGNNPFQTNFINFVTRSMRLDRPPFNPDRMLVHRTPLVQHSIRNGPVSNARVPHLLHPHTTHSPNLTQYSNSSNILCPPGNMAHSRTSVSIGPRSLDQLPTNRLPNAHNNSSNIQHYRTNPRSSVSCAPTTTMGISSFSTNEVDQSEPLDLSGKLTDTYQMSSKLFRQFPELTRKLDKELQQQEPTHVLDNASKLQNTRKPTFHAPTISNIEKVSCRLNDQINCIKNPEDSATQTETNNKNHTTALGSVDRRHGEISLPNEPNHIMDIDRWSEISPNKNIPEQSKSKKLPVQNYLSQSAGEKSYSHLALAAITSKRKKSARSRTSSENDDFLDFLRRDLSNQRGNEKATEGNTDFNVDGRLRNGDLIDLTAEENEDVLSISSDEVIEDINVMVEQERELTGSKKDSEIQKMTSTNAFAPTEPIIGHVAFSNLRANSTALSGSVKRKQSTDIGLDISTPEVTDFPRKDGGIQKYQQPKTQLCEHLEQSELTLECSPTSPEITPLVDQSEIDRIKKQSLQLSRPQKALWYKKLNNILLKYSKDIPYPAQSMTSVHPESPSERELPNPFKPDTSLNTDVPLSDSYHELPTCHLEKPQSAPLEIKRSSSLQTDGLHTNPPVNTNTCITSRRNSAYDGDYGPRKSHQLDLRLSIQHGIDQSPTAVSCQPAPNEEVNTELLSQYKTVWQTQFLTDEKNNDKLRYANDDIILRRLKLMHNAADSINNGLPFLEKGHDQTSVKISHVKGKHMRRSTVKHGGHVNPKLSEYFSPSAPNPDSPLKYPFLSPPESGRLNSFTPSHPIGPPLMVTSCLAIPYSFCSPVPTPLPCNISQPDAPHTSIPDGAKKQRRMRRVNAENHGPVKKRRTRKARLNFILETENLPQSDGIINEPSSLQSDNPIEKEILSNYGGVKTARQNHNMKDNNQSPSSDTIMLNPQHTVDLLKSHSYSEQQNIQELLGTEPDANAYLLQTRHEDGLTVLSMRCTDDLEPPEQSVENCNPGKRGRQEEQNGCCRIDLDLMNPEFSSITPYASGVEMKNTNDTNSTAAHTRTSVPHADTIGQNLATLALASETREKIPSPLYHRPFSDNDSILDDKNHEQSCDSRPQLNNYNDACPGGVNPQSQTQTLDMSSDKGKSCNDQVTEENQINELGTVTIKTNTSDTAKDPKDQSKMATQGITEKEKLVTEILASMMQNRNNLTSINT